MALYFSLQQSNTDDHRRLAVLGIPGEVLLRQALCLVPEMQRRKPPGIRPVTILALLISYPP